MIDLIKLRQECTDNFHLIKSYDGTELFVREWPAQKKIQTCIVIFHGITAHSKPYSVLGQPLAESGFTSYGVDLRGHGLSGGNRGDLESLDQFYEDMRAVLEFIQTRHEHIILLGHSLGVVSSVMIASKMPEFVGGLILLSAARNLRSNAYPKRSRLTTLKYAFWSIIRPAKPIIYYYREGIRGLDDPLFTFHYTLRFLKTISVSNFYWPSEMNYPVFYGIGDSDELFDITSGEELFNEIPAKDKTMDIMEKTQHAYFTEHSFDNLLDWVSLKFSS
jgi:pimeloyl-ACP methyl ester carboxylesterase